MNQRAVDVAPVFGGRGDLIFGDKDQIARARPTLKEILESFADNGFAVRTRNFFQVLELVQVLLNEDLAHWRGIIAAIVLISYLFFCMFSALIDAPPPMPAYVVRVGRKS